jgi:hypothetical protein
MDSSGDGDELYAPDTLLAHMSGQTSSGGSAQADICHVLEPKQSNGGCKGGNVKVNEESTTPDMLSILDTTYCLNKGETITLQGHQYFTHSTMIQYCVDENECASRDMALIDQGANGCICGDIVLVLAGSERFVDVTGLSGHCKNQFHIVSAQALIETHKGKCHCCLSSDYITWQRQKYLVMPSNVTVYAELEYFDSAVVDDILDAWNPELVQTIYEVQVVKVSPTPKDYDLLKPFFAWAPADTIKRTLSVTTQYARARVSDNLWQH